jgi:hypothetical protein
MPGLEAQPRAGRRRWNDERGNHRTREGGGEVKNETADIVEIDTLADGEIFSITVEVTRHDGTTERYDVVTDAPEKGETT